MADSPRKFRARRTPERVAYLVQWWPPRGTRLVATDLGLRPAQIHSKVPVLGLHLLPPAARLCAVCRAAPQDLRYGSRRWAACEVVSRRIRRAALPRTLARWVHTLLQMARGRSPVPCDLTEAYLLALWAAQEGRCFYSGPPLPVPLRGGHAP